MTRDVAAKYARDVEVTLHPLCERLEIAGSVRRRCAQVNDIDVVCIPRDLAELASFMRRRCHVVREGEVNLTYRRGGIQIDIFIAHAGTPDLLSPIPSNWGSILLCRTGSKEHNIQITRRARAMGMEWRTYHGLFLGSECIAAETEESILEALGMGWVPPERRHA